MVKLAKWKQYEKVCAAFLNTHFSGSDFSFKATGGSNSIDSDIKVLKNGNEFSNIEVKMYTAQSGQIVAIPSTNEFIFSLESKDTTNPYTQKILDYMNVNFDTFKDVNTKGIPLTCDEDILIAWVKYHYDNHKASPYLLFGKDKLITFIKFSDLEQHCKVTATYRLKRSGTSELAQTYWGNFLMHLKKHTSTVSASVLQHEFAEDGSKLRTFVYLNKKLKRQECYFNIDELECYLGFKEVENGLYKYEVRQRGTTNHANIVFSLIPKKPLSNYFGLEDFTNYINNL